MADEPKNNIEDALKSYARKRREEAGAFEMHPATRQMLQSEVAKLRPKPANKSRNWLVGLFEFGPKWGFALSVLVVLAVMYLAWRSPSARMEMASTQTKAPAAAADGDRLSESVSSRSDIDPVRIAKDAERRKAILSEELRDEQLKAETEQLGRASDLRRKSESADKKIMLGTELVLQDRTAEAPVPSAPTPAPAEPPMPERSLALSETDAFQQGQKPPGTRAARTVAGATPVDNVSTNMTVLAAASAASNAEQFNERMFYAGSEPSTLNLATVQQRFYKAQSADRGAQSGARLLEDFELQRTGDQIRIIDSDGSVYEGPVYDGVYLGENKQLEARRDNLARREVAPSNMPAADQPQPTASTSAPADTSVRFRASGTNRTLNQLVVFDGAMQSAVPVAAGAYYVTGVQAQSGEPAVTRQRAAAQEPAGPKTVSPPARRAQRPAQPSTNRILRVEGKARVGTTNQFEINALPR